MSTLDKSLFVRYAGIKKRIKELEEEAESLAPAVLSQMKENHADRIETDQGTFSVVKRKEWVFSEHVTKLQEQVNEAKKFEKADGTATFEENDTVSFRGKLAE